MKRSIVIAVLVALLLPNLALAADPDFWGVDSRLVPIGTQDVWSNNEGGIGNGDLVFGDWFMQVLYFFGGAVARRFA